jgi:PPOX class probable F420-dependent enzyme
VSAPLQDLPGWASRLLTEARVAHLGLVDDRDRPRVLPVTFVVHAGSLWSAVDDKPKRVPGVDLARIRFLERRPDSSLAVDHYEDDWSKLAWVLVMGQTRLVETSAEPSALEALRAKYEQYRRRTPGGPLLRLDPERALTWRA